MRTKTLVSLLVLCGSTAAVAHMVPVQDAPIQNEVTNEAAPAPEAPPADDTVSNTTDPTDNGSEAAPEPNAIAY